VTWLRLHLGSSGPLTLHAPHRQTLRDVVAAGHTWQALPYVAPRDEAKWPAQRSRCRGLGHPGKVLAPQDPTPHWSVRHLSGHARALAGREATRRQRALQAIAAALQRLQGLGNT
jgi:hypothetical protein